MYINQTVCFVYFLFSLSNSLWKHKSAYVKQAPRIITHVFALSHSKVTISWYRGAIPVIKVARCQPGFWYLTNKGKLIFPVWLFAFSGTAWWRPPTTSFAVKTSSSRPTWLNYIIFILYNHIIRLPSRPLIIRRAKTVIVFCLLFPFVFSIIFCGFMAKKIGSYCVVKSHQVES